jgi:hypothetical protein
MFGFRNYRNYIMNMIGGKCKYDTDDYKKAHKRMEEELAKDYAKRHECSVVSIFENGKFVRNIVVKD